MPDALSMSRRSALIAGVAAPVATAARLAPGPAGAILDVRDFGAMGDGQADDTVALQRAINRARDMPGGATVLLPAGRYAVGGLDLRPRGRDDFDRFLVLRGEGSGRTALVPAGIGAVLVDAAGRNNLTIEALAIDSGRLPSKAALVLGRLERSPNCTNGTFSDLILQGSYSVSTVVSIGAETTRWTNCRFANGHTGPAHRCFLTGNRPALVQGLDLGDWVDGPNTDNVMTGCVFYVPHDGAAPILFSGSAGYAFFGCSILGGEGRGLRLATYADPIDGVFNGPVAWHGCHLEVTGAGSCVHWIDAPAGHSYWRNLGMHGGYAVVASGTALVDFDRRDAGRRPVLQATTLLAPALPPGVAGANVHAYAITGSDIRMLGNTGSAVIAFGFVQDCQIDALDLRTPQIAGRPVRVARDPRRRQTFASGAVVENMDPDAGPVGSWVVPRGGAGTVAGSGRVVDPPGVGEIVEIAGRRHVLWHRAADGRPTLDPPAPVASRLALASPDLRPMALSVAAPLP